MKHKALLKLVLCYVVAALSMFVMLNYFGAKRLNAQFEKEKADLLTEEAGMIAEDRKRRSIDRFLGTRIWVVNTNGTVFVDTGEGSAARGINVDNYNPKFLDEIVTASYLTKITFPGVMPDLMLAVAQPIYLNYSLRAYVCIFLPMTSVKQSVTQYLDIVNICYIAFMVVLLVIFAVIYIITLAPVRRMTRVTEEYARGHFDVPMKVRSHDEYKSLANAIKFMADEYKNLDDYQKKFVGNISHDFRSPLTSIKGYAEAMADGTIPQEMQKKYLDIILFETERLTKLTTSLLTLNGFENKGVILEITSFDINEVIHRTALSFEGTCTKKRITLNLVFGDEVLFVAADMGKIQQVLYNLIDNAIKFSNADSSIDIKTEEKGNKVFVAVKDYGIGIPKDSIKRIWERFYKTDLSRGKDKKGTGLGLSIAKEIIQAHRENINVISTEGVGTEFIFTLAKSL